MYFEPGIRTATVKGLKDQMYMSMKINNEIVTDPMTIAN